MFKNTHYTYDSVQYNVDKSMGLVSNDLLEQYGIDITGETWDEALRVVEGIKTPQSLRTQTSPQFQFQRIIFHGSNLSPHAPTAATTTLECAQDRIFIDVDDQNIVVETAIR